MNSFDHDKLDVYRACIEFVALADDIVEQLPRGRILVEATCYDEARGLRLRIVSLLVRMAQGTGTGSDSGRIENGNRNGSGLGHGPWGPRVVHIQNRFLTLRRIGPLRQSSSGPYTRMFQDKSIDAPAGCGAPV